jgi:GDP-4-dehydro-6-deoxy-D-mannose reductase
VTNVLITGAGGFIGGVLAKHCLNRGDKVLGLDHKEPDDSWSGADFEVCDVREGTRLAGILSSFRPQEIYHLAAQSYPTVSMDRPRDTLEINISGTVNLFEGLRSAGMAPMVVVACSSAEYGPVAPEDLPVRETHALRPLHPYGVSKVGQDLLAAQYFTNYGMPTVRIRIFNTTGPGKVGDVCSDLTRRAMEIELGLRRSPLLVGNLTTRRALVDARDLVRGLCLAAERAEPGEVYNVGGSDIYSAEEVIEMIRGLVAVPFQIEQDPELMRPCDERVIAGDVSKFHARTGWKAEIKLQQTLHDMVDWWRNRLDSNTDTNEFEVARRLQNVRV